MQRARYSGRQRETDREGYIDRAADRERQNGDRVGRRERDIEGDRERGRDRAAEIGRQREGGIDLYGEA